MYTLTVICSIVYRSPPSAPQDATTATTNRMHSNKISASAAYMDIPVDGARATTKATNGPRCLNQLTFTVYLADRHTSSVVMEIEQNSNRRDQNP